MKTDVRCWLFVACGSLVVCRLLFSCDAWRLLFVVGRCGLFVVCYLLVIAFRCSWLCVVWCHLFVVCCLRALLLAVVCCCIKLFVVVGAVGVCWMLLTSCCCVLSGAACLLYVAGFRGAPGLLFVVVC